MASFRGVARVERDPETLSGRIVGTGNDQRSRSSTQREIRYRLVPTDANLSTHVELSIGYSLQGVLAQIARDGPVRDPAVRLTLDFCTYLELHISGAQPGPAQQEKSLDGFALMFWPVTDTCARDRSEDLETLA